MSSNRFGTLFTITTWGESHGEAIGVVIDGCPAGLPLSVADIQEELIKRQPGQSPYTSPRKEPDEPRLLSGVFEGKTTGTPISIVIFNKDAKGDAYEPIKHLLRPGHANFTYLEKYGIFDYRGGGRASGRETACRVAAGAVAKKILAYYGVSIVAYIKEIGGIEIKEPSIKDIEALKRDIAISPLFCPDEDATQHMITAIESVKEEGDSLGGVVEVMVLSLPSGLGDPVYEKLEAKLASAMLSIPSTKGFEIGSGFEAARMKGSDHNDPFTLDQNGKIITETNYAGGTLGGISTGMPLTARVAFKPPSTIQKPQKTVSLEKEDYLFEPPSQGRHDPCIAIRAVPVVEAMTALVLVDTLLMNRSIKI